jgi:hypothetical protein
MTIRERQRQVQLYRGRVSSPGAADDGLARGSGAFLGGHRAGVSSMAAQAGIGASPAVGTRWFRHAGGVDPKLPPTVSGRYLSFASGRTLLSGTHRRRARVR